MSTTVVLAAVSHLSPRHVKIRQLSHLVWTPSKRPESGLKGGGETLTGWSAVATSGATGLGGKLINSKHTLWSRALVIDYPANCSGPLSICHIHLSDSAATCGAPLVETAQLVHHFLLLIITYFLAPPKRPRTKCVSEPRRRCCAEDLNALWAGSIWIHNESFLCKNRGTTTPQGRKISTRHLINISYVDIFHNKTPLWELGGKRKRQVYDREVR